MKDARIHKLRQWAERDLRISHCARTLLFRIFSDRYCDPHRNAADAFKLPWTQVAHWCGLVDRDHCHDLQDSLVSNGWLYFEGLRGCPPTRTYKLNLKYDPTPLMKDGIIGGASRKKAMPHYVKKGLAALRAVKNS
jgi:hypothetical protein